MSIERPTKHEGLFIKIGQIALLMSVCLLYLWLAQWDPLHRTVFVEEMNGGEAGRAAYLFGTWKGEGGNWQSAIFEPFGTFLNWLGLSIGGFSRFGMRLPFLILSCAAILQFAFITRKIAPEKPFYSGMAFLTLAFSPFLIHVIPTGLNESAFLFCILTLFSVVQLEGSPVFKRHRILHKILLAITCSLAVFVDWDGVIIPFCCTVVIIIRAVKGEISKKECAAFFFAGTVMATLLGVLLLRWFGWEEINRMIAMGKEMNARPLLSPNPSEKLTRMLINFPKNLNLFVPGLFSLTLIALSYGYIGRKNLTPSVLLAILIICVHFLMSFSFPLIYWKRFIYYLPCCLVLALWAVSNISAENSDNPRKKFWLGVGFTLSILFGFSTYLSSFKLMVRIYPFWVEDTWKSISLLAIPLVAGALCLIYKGYADKLMRSVFIAVSATSIVFGLIQLSIPRHTQAQDIGVKIAEMTSERLVVADHHALRFFGYSSLSPVMFTHENDPDYPDKIYTDIEHNAPEFVVVTDSYGVKSKVILEKYPEYAILGQFDYIHAPLIFFKKPRPVKVFVFKKQKSHAR